MKITDVEAIVVRQPSLDGKIADGSQDDLVIRISTDEGVEGIGEVDSSPEVARAVITAPRSHSLTGGLRDVLIGEDPLDIERLWERMYQGAIFLGRRGVAIHALSGIDIALWDIKGKVLGQPISALIGAPQRDRVRAYASMLMPDTPAEVRERVAEARDHRFTAVKLGWGPLGQSPANDVALAAAACEAAGDDVAIMIDAGFAYGADPAQAIPVARELEALGVYWLEEPFQPDEVDAYAELADSVELRIAAGEQDATLWSFRDLIERGHIDVVQPDVTRCGGITEILRIADAAQAAGVQPVPHAWKSGIIKAASLHVNAVLSGTEVFQEYCVRETPINRDLTHETFSLDENGYVAVPTAPGLGVTLSTETVERYRVD
jgi:L-alanine-DL-glutamate epimerase-like enolase superfamily enzyme